MEGGSCLENTEAYEKILGTAAVPTSFGTPLALGDAGQLRFS